MEAIIEKDNKRGIDLSRVKNFVIEYGILFALAIFILLLSMARPSFLGINNILNVLRQVSINGYLAIGMTFVVLTGGIDLSVGSTVALSGVLAATVAKNHDNPLILMIAIGLAAGMVIGLANGFIIAKGGLAPFIVTLGMMSIVRGITFVYSDGRPIPNLKPEFLTIGRESLFNIPIPVVILIAVLLIAWFSLYKIKFGRYVFSIGGNEQASMVSGLNVSKIKLLVYAISGMLAGLAGIVLTSRVTSGLPQAGTSYELDAIAAVVIGGTTLSGGKGRLWGTVVGFILIGIINNGLDLLNVSSFYQLIVKGSIIIFAVFLDSRTSK